ncbi:MAG TPA: WD40 repeat domain-containing protein [Candidatus Angelobacter sp.]|nr:WD40 repeat domain-containing protein [Candidatus Angelobacter sp.]
MRWPYWLVSTVLVLLLIGCGGGGGGNPTNPITITPSFAVVLSSSNLTLTQGGSQTIQVSITPQSGFTGQVSVNALGLPAGVTVSPASLSLTSAAPGIFTFSASSTAGLVQQSATVEAISGSLKVDAPLQFNVSGAGIPDPFHVVGGTLGHGFYDQSRQLLFATNPGLNEVDVISGTDFSVRARVQVPQAWGIDQMADNKTLIIGTFAQEIVTVDEDTLMVTQHPVTGIAPVGLFYPNVVALANGKVLIIGQEQGVASNDVVDGGQFLVKWDSIANTFQVIEPTGQLIWETDRLARSADHKWAVFSADQFYLYSSDTDTLTSVPLDMVDPPQDMFGVRGYAMNADGTKIAVATVDTVTFLDRSFNILGSTAIPDVFQNARTSEEFSPDGNRLLLQYDLPTAIEALDANLFTALGFYPADVNPEDSFARLLGTNLAGHAFVGSSSGFLTVDISKAPVPNAGSALGGAFCPLPVNITNLPLNLAVQAPITAHAGTTYYFGGQPAPLLANATQIAIPSSSISGPVDIECVDTNGNTLVHPLGFSYGMDPIGVSANLLPPTGNPSIVVLGFGFSTITAEMTTVTVGGQPALSVTPLDSVGFGSLQGAVIRVPTEAPGQSADITVSSVNGSANLADAVTYIPSATIIPASGLLQVLYDPHRSLLYALKATEIDVFNPATLQFQSSFPLPGTAVSDNYNVMALSPDGSKLIAGSPDGYAAVLDPDVPSGVSVVTLPAKPGFQSGSIAITKFNKAVISGASGIEIDLTTLATKTILSLTPDLVRASADGNFLYGAGLNAANGEVYAIDPATYSAQTTHFGFFFWTDFAVSPDGSQIATIEGAPGVSGDFVGFFDPELHLVNSNEYPLISPPNDTQVLGSTFGPQGKVLVVPLGDSIEFWDAAKGTLRARLMTPEELQVLVFPEGPVAPTIALDATGQTIFAISKTGLTVLTLPQDVDDLAANPWALGVQSTVNQVNVFQGFKGRVAVTRSTKPE